MGFSYALPYFVLFFLIGAVFSPLNALAGPGKDTLMISGCSVLAIPVNEPVKLDGRLDEPFWQRVPPAENFLQRIPDTGKPASQATRVRVAIAGDDLIIGAELFESAPDSIARTLFRKDGSVFSDWFAVGFDSYNDRRTSFTFEVNPLGVRRDFMIIDDIFQDYSWEAVWQAVTAARADAWVVELRIPLSQLRYSSTRQEHWGINFARHIARRNEWSFWAHTPPEIPGMVSHYGRMAGARQIPGVRRVEIIPYAAQQLTSNGDAAKGNPYLKPVEPFTNAGLDLRIGLTPEFTMTTAINPDFGQAEVDPAVVNLSAFEIFFPERRSFFLEGMDIFRYGQTRTFNVSQRPTFFYSRRIGRTPSVGIPEDYTYADIPRFSTIAAATKLSGKTKNGFSLGLLNAITTTEFAPYLREDSTSGRSVVEPASNFFVGRVKQDFNRGTTVAGAFLTTVHRRLDRTYLESALRREAYLGGVDFEHNWRNRQRTVSGVFATSLVRAEAPVMMRTQMSNIRSFQRPDARYLRVDSSATALAGHWAELAYARRSGNWVSSLSLMSLSPGFEVNDLGFQTMADRRGINLYHEYQQNRPTGIFQNYSINGFFDYIWNFGGNMVEHDYFVGAFFRFRNFWNMSVNGNTTPRIYNDRLTRGGPLAYRPSDRRVMVRVESDTRRKLSVETGVMYRTDESGEWDKEIWLEINARPAPAINLTIAPSFNTQFDTDQYVASYADASAVQNGGRRYVFSDIYQKTVAATIRLDWTFLPDLSLQVFAQPFYSAGKFTRYKEFARPSSFDFTYYDEVSGGFQRNPGGTITVDPDGSGPALAHTFGEQNFNVASLRGNGVLRYEFRPGTIFFLIWQQNRLDQTTNPAFNLIDDNDRLMRRKPVNIFLAKLSWWFG